MRKALILIVSLLLTLSLSAEQNSSKVIKLPKDKEISDFLDYLKKSNKTITREEFKKEFIAWKNKKKNFPKKKPEEINNRSIIFVKSKKMVDLNKVYNSQTKKKSYVTANELDQKLFEKLPIKSFMKIKENLMDKTREPATETTSLVCSKEHKESSKIKCSDGHYYKRVFEIQKMNRKNRELNPIKKFPIPTGKKPAPYRGKQKVQQE